MALRVLVDGREVACHGHWVVEGRESRSFYWKNPAAMKSSNGG